jgi:hypothetical protein
LEEQLAGSYSVTNYDQNATVSGFNLTITDQLIDPATVINMPLGEEGMTNPLSGLLKMDVRFQVIPFFDSIGTIDETLTGTWMAKKAGDTGLDSLIWVDADGLKTRFGIQSWDKTTLVLKGTLTEVDPDMGPITLNQDVTLVKK